MKNQLILLKHDGKGRPEDTLRIIESPATYLPHAGEIIILEGRKIGPGVAELDTRWEVIRVELSLGGGDGLFTVAHLEEVKCSQSKAWKP